MTTNYNDRRNSKNSDSRDNDGIIEKVVQVRRVTKVVKGGRNLRFSAMVVAGDKKGKVGVASGKGAAVPDAVRKAANNARKNMVSVQMKGTTLPYQVNAKYGAAKIMLKPASPGTGVIAGGGIRAVMEAVGVQDVLSKNLGSNNPVNTVKATVKALTSLKDPEQYIAQRKNNFDEKKSDNHEVDNEQS